MSRSARRTAPLLTLTVALVLALAACGGNDSDDSSTTVEGSEPGDQRITVYSGRSESLVAPLFEQFTEATGIEVEARYAATAQMAAQLLEEGDRSPADVFLAQDAGALGAVNKDGLFAELPQEALTKIPEIYRSADGKWVGVSGRSRVLVYNPDAVEGMELPTSVFDLTAPEWKGHVAVAPTNASFQAFVTAIRVQHGDDKARHFLDELVANDAEIRDNNVQIVEDVEAGKVAVGLVNHYYLGEVAKERGTTVDGLDAKLHFFPNGDVGALVNVAGVGVLAKAADDPDVAAFIDYLLGPEAQTYFAEETFEYPLVDGIAAPSYVPPLNQLTAPAIDLNDLDGLAETVAMIEEAGLTP